MGGGGGESENREFINLFSFCFIERVERMRLSDSSYSKTNNIIDSFFYVYSFFSYSVKL